MSPHFDIDYNADIPADRPASSKIVVDPMSALSVLPPFSDASPFLLDSDHVETLSQSSGFAILRDHLAQHYHFNEHAPACCQQFSQWLLVRDTLHAILVPVVELFDKAAALAATATRATRFEELEYAFTGDARSAFLWLQCFLSSPTEREWCYARGCPACVVEHSLESEFNVRILYAACLLSDVHYPFTIDGPTLPSFAFFIDVLRTALTEDTLFGAEFFDRLRPKAVATRHAVEDLIHQCVDLENLILSTPASPTCGASSASSETVSPVLAPLGANPSAGKAKLKVKRGKLARQQMSLKMEEERWMQEMVDRCWVQLQNDTETDATMPDTDTNTIPKSRIDVLVNEVSPDD